MTLSRRRRLRSWLALLAGLGSALLSGSPAPRAERAGAALSTVVLVRHAEKAGPDGDVPLSAAGKKRAARLALVLRNAEIGHVFTSELTRTRQTAAPLAARLGLTPQALPTSDLDALVARLRALPAGEVALVVHHSNTVPVLVEKLGGPRVPPIAEGEFDRLLILTRAPDGATRLVTIRY
jgi:broad specificity phosphatase PhoE